MRVALLGMMGFLLSACTVTPWGMGINTDKGLPPNATANGIVVVLGDEAFARASARLTNTLQKNWPDGIVLSGETSLDGQSIGLGELTIIYKELWLDLGLIDVQSYKDELGVELTIESPYVEIQVLSDGVEVCSETLAFHGFIDSRVSLGQDKVGRVQSTMIDATMVGIEKANATFGPCDYALGPVLFHDGMQEVGQSLASQLSGSLGPVLEASLPGALGLNLAMDYAVSLGDNPAELGMGRGQVRASPAPDETFWTFVDGRIAVPFAVSLDADQALCVPEQALPHPPSKLMPQLKDEPDAVLFLNAAVATKALAVAWQTGLICDDRLAASVDLPVQLLRSMWPALENFGSDAPLNVRVWPRATPKMSLLDGEFGATLRLETGLIRLEIMIAYDDTWLRVATIEVEAEIEGPLLVDSNGIVHLDPMAIDVVTVDAVDGLYRGPDIEAIEAMTDTLVQSVLTERALFQLPPLATEAGQLTIELKGDYLSFNKVTE